MRWHLHRNYRVSIVITVFVMAAMIVVACMPIQPVVEVDAQPASTADQAHLTAAVNAIWEEYAANLNAGDIERWVDLWTEEGVQMPPGEPFVSGKEAILARNAGVFAPFDVDMRIDNLEVGGGSAYAFARGVYTATLTPKEGGNPIPIDGKYMTILQQQPDGSWKVHRDIFNTNAPPPAPVEVDVEAATAEVEALWEEYAASLNAGDAERWIQLWMEDGVQMPPGAPPNVGRETIFAGISAALEQFSFDNMVIHNEEVEISGDLAVARGTYSTAYVPRDGSVPIPVDGKFMSILKRQPDGSWKLYRDIFNSNVSAQ